MKARWLVPIVFAVAILHELLLGVLKKDQIVASLFAAGGSLEDIAVATLFVGLRLTLYLAGPGLLVFGLLSFRRAKSAT